MDILKTCFFFWTNIHEGAPIWNMLHNLCFGCWHFIRPRGSWIYQQQCLKRAICRDTDMFPTKACHACVLKHDWKKAQQFLECFAFFWEEGIKLKHSPAPKCDMQLEVLPPLNHIFLALAPANLEHGCFKRTFQPFSVWISIFNSFAAWNFSISTYDPVETWLFEAIKHTHTHPHTHTPTQFWQELFQYEISPRRFWRLTKPCVRWTCGT